MRWPLPPAIQKVGDENEQIENQPYSVDDKLQLLAGGMNAQYKGKDQLPAEIECQGPVRHAVSLVPVRVKNDQQVNQSPANTADQG